MNEDNTRAICHLDVSYHDKSTALTYSIAEDALEGCTHCLNPTTHSVSFLSTLASFEVFAVDAERLEKSFAAMSSVLVNVRADLTTGSLGYDWV